MRTLAVLHYAAGTAALLAAGSVLVRLVAGPDLTAGWNLPPMLRQWLAGLAFGPAAWLLASGLAAIFLGRRIRLGRRWVWYLMMALCVPAAGLTLVTGLRGREVNLLGGLVLPVVYAILLAGAPARRWFGVGRAGRLPVPVSPPWAPPGAADRHAAGGGALPDRPVSTWPGGTSRWPGPTRAWPGTTSGRPGDTRTWPGGTTGLPGAARTWPDPLRAWPGRGWRSRRARTRARRRAAWR